MVALKFPPGEFIKDELNARGWTTRDLAERMGGDIDRNHCCVDLLVYAPAKGMMLDAETSRQLGRAFGVSDKFFAKLDEQWQQSTES